jgi:hypothetical protein
VEQHAQRMHSYTFKGIYHISLFPLIYIKINTPNLNLKTRKRFFRREIAKNIIPSPSTYSNRIIAMFILPR